MTYLLFLFAVSGVFSDEVQGVIVKKISPVLYDVKMIDNEEILQAEISGQAKRAFFRVSIGDTVIVKLYTGGHAKGKILYKKAKSQNYLQ